MHSSHNSWLCTVYRKGIAFTKKAVNTLIIFDKMNANVGISSEKVMEQDKD